METIIGNNQTIDIIKEMIIEGIIPKTSSFEITDELMEKYYCKYCKTFPEKAKQHKKKEIRFFKKLAGLSLLKLSLSRIETKDVSNKTKNTNKIKSGILYLISNPAFPNLYKIGITQDLTKRLLTYQTYDPFRKFIVEHYKIVENMKEEESKILMKYKINISEGEWIDNDKVKEIFIEFI
jgi:predicted GIY-YIG superfamily endonuclease